MPDTDSPVALAAYDALADDFAESAPEKPYNADLERPATRDLLPDLDGLDVLDAGCGPGITTEELLDAGATVVAGDVSSAMLAHARERVGAHADLVRLDFAQGFPFADDAFDLVHASLAFTYARDWGTLFAEVARVLRPGGRVVFSTQHPMDDAIRLDVEDYFETEAVSETWDGFSDSVEMHFFRRPLEVTLNTVLDAGLRIERVVEPEPTDRFREKAPAAAERIRVQPPFLCVRARLPPAPGTRKPTE
ncbi:class I SAM-dependent methyltransferase [Halobacterium zhouii]|uniref:class I SAM-dependent methyltransferase n=1 Tax=Halobacterium zhouii TaxID=2902624 RepID=UPI001E46D2AF|nr:class I SAM-dependent methyltransferase [Halobacterium zhouii]